MNAGGKSHGGRVRAAALAAAAMVAAPGVGVAEQPSVAGAARARTAAIPRMAAPAHGDPRTTGRPRDTARAIDRPGEPLPEVWGGHPTSTVAAEKGEAAGRANGQVDVALQPTWDRGFWLLPPGGLIRYLLLPPDVIDVEDVVAWLPRSP